MKFIKAVGVFFISMIATILLAGVMGWLTGSAYITTTMSSMALFVGVAAAINWWQKDTKKHREASNRTRNKNNTEKSHE